jgi:hypothetical protein
VVSTGWGKGEGKRSKFTAGLIAKGDLYARFMGQRLVIIINQSDASVQAIFLASPTFQVL